MSRNWVREGVEDELYASLGHLQHEFSQYRFAQQVKWTLDSSNGVVIFVSDWLVNEESLHDIYNFCRLKWFQGSSSCCIVRTRVFRDGYEVDFCFPKEVVIGWKLIVWNLEFLVRQTFIVKFFWIGCKVVFVGCIFNDYSSEIWFLEDLRSEFLFDGWVVEHLWAQVALRFKVRERGKFF